MAIMPDPNDLIYTFSHAPLLAKSPRKVAVLQCMLEHGLDTDVI